MRHGFPARPTLAALVAALLGTAGLGAALPAYAQSASADCPLGRSLLLVNGKIHTMDARDSVVSSVLTDGNRFAAAGGKTQPGPCIQRIDLKGRTVVPGLIDNHNHVVLLGLRPGHDTRLENAQSIADVLATLGEKAKTLPAGEWITSIGGFDINQFTPAPAPVRFPTLQELDTVTPSHPVFIQQSFAGPSVTNSLGKAFFESKGIEVGADGALAGGFQTPNSTTRALFALRQLQTLDDMKRGTLDAQRYAASVGVTTHLDEGAFPAAGYDADGAAHADEYHVYDALLALFHEGRLINRYRIDFLTMEADVNTPHLKARLPNVFPKYGADMLKTVGIGEFTAGDSAIIGAATPAWENGTKLVAEAGWRNENHSLTPARLQGDHRRLGEDQRVAARTRHHASALGRRARAVHHARVRRQAQGARRRRQRARRLALHQRHGAAERAAVQDAEGSRHPDGHELRRHADLADEPVARALLRRNRQECARRAHQRGPDARA